jgi:hypothetical protein
MKPLKIILAAIVGLLAVAALAAGFVVVAVIGAIAVVILLLRQIFTGKPFLSFKFQVRRQRPSAAPRKFGRGDAIDIEATPTRPPPKSLEE